ncbi:MAG: hypothetical protein WCC36_08505, partial [Gammaproteobacteria bacterium]
RGGCRADAAPVVPGGVFLPTPVRTRGHRCGCVQRLGVAGKRDGIGQGYDLLVPHDGQDLGGAGPRI